MKPHPGINRFCVHTICQPKRRRRTCALYDNSSKQDNEIAVRREKHSRRKMGNKDYQESECTYRHLMSVHTGGIIGPLLSVGRMPPPCSVGVTVFESLYYNSQSLTPLQFGQDNECRIPTFWIKAILSPTRAENVRASSGQCIVPASPSIKGTVAI